MKWSKYILTFSLALICSTGFAEQKASAVVVTGNDWLSSSSSERHAFMIGVTNMLIAEAAYAKKHGLEAPPMGAQIANGVTGLKLPDIEARITNWYQANPTQQSVPVMGVLWQAVVKAKH
ncbi:MULTISPECIES: hypothetical protein [Pseudomonas]|uniref:Uncharacterized protein n=1 Tax=Pseudomonas segetis TaxID=298908 RepID=A0A239CFD7_9PSED|nr:MULTISPECIES: hypothetical protein [Pseudomonas]SNS18381.1 hypothetical protein SAMN05216255_1657 [Pseudomonas segetis]